MNSHRLVSSRFPYLPVHLQVRGRAYDFEALLDTGFDGDIALPPGVLASHQPPAGNQRWTLADGSRVTTPYYLGTAQFGQLAPFDAVITALGDEPIVGRATSDRFYVTLDHGRLLVVEP